MQVILLKNVNGLGLVGDIVNVANGYFRNFLSPKKLALVANPKSIKQLEHQKRIIDARKAQEKEISTGIKKGIESLSLSITRQANSGGHLFGSVTNTDIAKELEAKDVLVDRKMIKIDPIKSVGDHEVEIKLHPEVSAVLKLKVEGQVPEEKIETAAHEIPSEVAPEANAEEVEAEATEESTEE